MSISSDNVVNRTGGIETKDGRILYGLDAETYLKMTSKEDPELEKKVAKWIESVMNIKFSMIIFHLFHFSFSLITKIFIKLLMTLVNN